MEEGCGNIDEVECRFEPYRKESFRESGDMKGQPRKRRSLFSGTRVG